MGAATRKAEAAIVSSLEAQKKVSLQTAADLFAASRALAGQTALTSALTDQAAPVEARVALANRVFESVDPGAREVLVAAASQRWSEPADLLKSIFGLGIRAAAQSGDSTKLASELLGVSRVVAENPELELALSGRSGTAVAKSALAEKVFADSLSDGANLILQSIVGQPGRARTRSGLATAVSIVSGAGGQKVATVHTAAPLTPAQREQLQEALSAKYDGQIALSEVVDASLIGGVRVQVGDDVIDGTVQARLADLRQKIAS